MEFCVVTLFFGFFCWCRGFCHRTESDIFLFLWLRYFIHIVLNPILMSKNFLSSNFYQSITYTRMGKRFRKLQKTDQCIDGGCPQNWYKLWNTLELLTTPVGWLSLLQLTVLIQSAIVNIEVFVGVFVLSLCIFEFFVGVRTFVVGLSQISSFFSVIGGSNLWWRLSSFSDVTDDILWVYQNRGVGSIFRLRGHQKCKPQIESRSRNLITKWKYKLEDI